jgi:integrase
MWDKAKRLPKDAAQAARVEEIRYTAQAALRKFPNRIPVLENQYKRRPDKGCFLAFFAAWCREKSGTVTVATQATHLRTLRKMRAFAGKKETLPFHAIDAAWIDGFATWMRATGCGADYTRKTVRHLRDALTSAEAKGIYQGDGHVRQQRREKREEIAPKVYLRTDEIQALAALELPDHLRKIRDAFLISCYTGVRRSDLQAVRQNAVETHNGRKVLRIKMQKTGRYTAVAVSPELGQLLQLYPEGIAPCSIQHANKALKKIAQSAGIAVWAKVTTHTGRRSFATNGFLAARGNWLSVMTALGHSTEKQFRAYFRLDEVAAIYDKALPDDSQARKQLSVYRPRAHMTTFERRMAERHEQVRANPRVQAALERVDRMFTFDFEEPSLF